MYLFLGIFPYSRPVDQKQFAKITRLRFSTRKTRERKRRRSLLLLFSLSLSLSPQRDHARESVVPSLSAVVVVVYVITRFRERKDDGSLKIISIKRKVHQKGQGQGPPPPSCELTTTTTNNINTSKKKTKRGEGIVCVKKYKNTQFSCWEKEHKRGRKERRQKKNANSISSREKKNCLKSVHFLSKRLIRKETLVATTTDKTPRKEKKPRAPTPPGRGFVLSRFLFAASREVKPPACSWWWCF